MEESEEFAFAKKEIMTYSKLLYDRGLISAAGGNVSMRCGERVLITGSNVPLREVHPEDIVVCDMEGNPVIESRCRPSKELRFHLSVYRLRPEVRCVIHSHPVYSIIWSLQKQEMPLYTESARLKLKYVPIVPDGVPGSEQLARYVTETLEKTPEEVSAFLMEGHGCLTMGATMQESFQQTELLEDSAKIAVFQQIINQNR